MTTLPIIHRIPGTPEDLPTDLSETESYEYLLQAIHDIIDRGRQAAKLVLVRTKHEIGELVATHPDYVRHQHGARAIIRKLAQDCEVSDGEIYSCVRFYNRAALNGGLEPFLKTLQAGPEATWSGIKKLLPLEEGDLKVPKKKRPPNANRPSACRYAKLRVGEVWREEDQEKLRDLLAVRL